MRILLLSVFVALLLGIVLVPAAFEQASAQTVGLKEGQWVKYTVDCRAYAFISDEEQKKKLKDKLDEDCSKSMKQRYGVANADNIEWYKVKVSKIDGTKVTFDESIKVKGSAEKSMGSSISNIGRNDGFPEWAIPVGLRVGDQIATPKNYSPLKVYEIKNISEDILWKDEGFENVEFLYLISENRIMQGGKKTDLYANFWFERSTGILLANEIGTSIIYDEYGDWTDISIDLELLDFSTGGIKVQEKTDPDSLSFKEAERKITNLEGTGRYIINKVCCDNMGDDNIVNKYEILTANHEEIGMIQIEGKDKVDVIWANSYFDFAQGGATRDDANDIMLEIQNKFVPESRAISPSMIWMKHQDEAYAETKKVGSRTIEVESSPSMILGTSFVEFILKIDYGMAGSVPSQPPMEDSKISAQEKIEPDSLTFGDVETRLTNIEESGRYLFENERVQREDDRVTKMYSIFTVYQLNKLTSVPNVHLGNLAIGGQASSTANLGPGFEDNVHWMIASSSFFDRQSSMDDANDIILELQLKFVPESSAVSPSMIFASHPDDKYVETKKVGSRTIEVESDPTWGEGVEYANKRCCIFWLTISNFQTESVFQQQTTTEIAEVTAGVSEQAASAGDSTEFNSAAVAIGGLVTIFIVILIIKRKKKTEIAQQEPRSVLQQPAEEEQTLSYDLPSRKRSNRWYLLPIFLGFIGGIIAYFVLRKDDPKKAKNCLIIGIGTTVIGIFLFPF